jgi:hypothetical protein
MAAQAQAQAAWEAQMAAQAQAQAAWEAEMAAAVAAARAEEQYEDLGGAFYDDLLDD